MNSRDGPLFLGGCMLMNSRGGSPFEGCILMNSKEGPPFEGLYVDEFQRPTPFLGLYVDEFQSQTPHLQRGSASRDNFYGSSGIFGLPEIKPNNVQYPLSLFILCNNQVQAYQLVSLFYIHTIQNSFYKISDHKITIFDLKMRWKVVEKFLFRN